MQSPAGRQDAFWAVPDTGKLGSGLGPARSPLSHRSGDSPLHHWNGCINEVKVGSPERTETRCWSRRGLCTETAGMMEMQLPEEWSQGLQRGRFAEQQRAQRRKQSLSERSPAEGPGWEGSRGSRDARPRRQQQRGHEAGLGSHCAEQCALGFRKLTPSSSHPLPMTAPSREPASFSSPALRPMGVFLLPPGIIYKPVYLLDRAAFFFFFFSG